MRRALCELALMLWLPQAGMLPPPVMPPLTEIESLRIENARLEGAVIQHEAAAWQIKVAKLKADLEAARPGWTWNSDTGAWTPPKAKS